MTKGGVAYTLRDLEVQSNSPDEKFALAKAKKRAYRQNRKRRRQLERCSILRAEEQDAGGAEAMEEEIIVIEDVVEPEPEPQIAADCTICLAPLELEGAKRPNACPPLHLFHETCILQHINHSSRGQRARHAKCPICRRLFTHVVNKDDAVTAVDATSTSTTNYCKYCQRQESAGVNLTLCDLCENRFHESCRPAFTLPREDFATVCPECFGILDMN